jgi:succinate dehydrogenase/fumarate reductase flavoprotein subunit
MHAIGIFIPEHGAKLWRAIVGVTWVNAGWWFLPERNPAPRDVDLAPSGEVHTRMLVAWVEQQVIPRPMQGCRLSKEWLGKANSYRYIRST